MRLSGLFLGLVLGSIIVASRLVRRADPTTVVIAAATPVAVFVLLGLRQQTTSEAADVATDLALHGGEGGPWALAKHDVTTGARQLRTFAPEQLPSEAVYVAGTGATDEDAGYHFTVISSGDQSPAELLVLDATDIAAEPVAVVELPRHVPGGVHGSWIPTEA